MIKIYQIPGNKLAKLIINAPELGVSLSLGTHKVTEEEFNNNYKLMWRGDVGTTNLEEIFMIFNIGRPKDYITRSLSCGDVVETPDGVFCCMTFGWEKILNARSA